MRLPVGAEYEIEKNLCKFICDMSSDKVKLGEEESATWRVEDEVKRVHLIEAYYVYSLVG